MFGEDYIYKMDDDCDDDDDDDDDAAAAAADAAAADDDDDDDDNDDYDDFHAPFRSTETKHPLPTELVPTAKMVRPGTTASARRFSMFSCGKTLRMGDPLN